MQHFREDGTSEPMPRGGSTSPLEKYAQQILALIREQPDFTLDEIVLALHKRRIPGSRSALSRFFARHRITIKKSLRAAERKRADVARARRRWIREQGLLDPARLVFIDGVPKRRTERRKKRLTSYSCAKDEGGPLGSAFREQVSNQSELLR